jgi:HEAT repeat protein
MSRRPNIRRLARKKQVERLAAALRYTDWARTHDGREADVGVDVRRRAVEALAEMEAPEALQAIAEEAFTDEDPKVRLTSAKALHGRSEPAAVEALGRAVLDWEDPVYAEARAAALAALRAAPPAEAAGPLARSLVERPADNGSTNERGDWLLKELAQRDERGAEAAVRQLTESLAGDRVVQERAVRSLAALAPESSPALIEALDDPARCARAAEALGESGDGRAVEPLIALLTRPDPAARRAAAEALGKLGDPQSAEGLLASTRDEEYEVRVAAAQALDSLGSIAVMLGVASMLRPAIAAGGGQIEVETPVEAGSARLEIMLGARDGGAGNGSVEGELREEDSEHASTAEDQAPADHERAAEQQPLADEERTDSEHEDEHAGEVETLTGEVETLADEFAAIANDIEEEPPQREGAQVVEDAAEGQAAEEPADVQVVESDKAAVETALAELADDGGTDATAEAPVEEQPPRAGQRPQPRTPFARLLARLAAKRAEETVVTAEPVEDVAPAPADAESSGDAAESSGDAAQSSGDHAETSGDDAKTSELAVVGQGDVGQDNGATPERAGRTRVRRSKRRSRRSKRRRR